MAMPLEGVLEQTDILPPQQHGAFASVTEAVFVSQQASSAFAPATALPAIMPLSFPSRATVLASEAFTTPDRASVVTVSATTSFFITRGENILRSAAPNPDTVISYAFCASSCG